MVRKTLAVPIVDSINWNTLEHREVYASKKRYKGIFEWGFLYKEMAVSEQDFEKLEHGTSPYWYVQ
jgi:polypeptide N-acetylgalactosaminyltransferase